MAVGIIAAGFRLASGGQEGRPRLGDVSFKRKTASMPQGIRPKQPGGSVMRPQMSRAFPAKTESPSMLYLFVFTQFRPQNRCALLLELLYRRSGPVRPIHGSSSGGRRQPFLVAAVFCFAALAGFTDLTALADLTAGSAALRFAGFALAAGMAAISLSASRQCRSCAPSGRPSRSHISYARL
jgi:hypothetical protein